MDHWPEWGMPVENWQQQGSYVSPIEEALPDPAAGTLVCIPPLNPALLKYIAGCLDQLRNPSTYDGLSDADIALSLQRADTLRGLVGHPVACVPPAMYEVRLNACVLEQSTDGGSTWSAVPGWEGFAACLPSLATDAIAIPSNPQGVSTTQQGCNIAGYVAQQIIQGVFNTLQQAISEGRSAIQFATDLSVGAFIFRTVFPYTTAALLGIDALLSLGASIGASELATIVADVVLWDDITCAIYLAIKADGRITASNWPTAIANVRAISYGVPLVASGIADWLQSVDMATVYEWQQLAPIDTVDCSGCGTWCYKWDFAAGQAGWVLYPGETASYVAGSPGYWTGHPIGDPTVVQMGVQIDMGRDVAVSAFSMWMSLSHGIAGDRFAWEVRNSSHALVAARNYPGTAMPVAAEASWSPVGATGRYLDFSAQFVGSPGDLKVFSVEAQGPGANPFGADNCTY